MRIANKKLEWYVINYDSNSKCVKRVNVFLGNFKEELYKAYKSKKITNKLELKEYVKRYLMYHYWCKSECEVLVGSLHHRDTDEFEKIDMYYQLEKNLDHIVDYINTYLDMKLV